MNLTAFNTKKEMLTTSFHVNFVDKDDTDIYAVAKNDSSKKVLYNCGDGGFSFSISGFFNGPNYELKTVPQSDNENCKDGGCYFNITNKDMRIAY